MGFSIHVSISNWLSNWGILTYEGQNEIQNRKKNLTEKSQFQQIFDTLRLPQGKHSILFQLTTTFISSVRLQNKVTRHRLN